MSELKAESSIANDPLAMVIQSITLSMQADYGATFKRTFASDKDIRNLKRRLYAKLRDLPIDCIIDGYEMCVSASTKFCPLVPDIVGAVLAVMKQRKKQAANDAEASRMAALPNPNVKAQPERVIVLLREALKVPKGDEATRWARLAATLAAHDGLIETDKAMGLIRQGASFREHGCRHAFCGQPGVLSHGTSGGDNWYCGEHFPRSV